MHKVTFTGEVSEYQGRPVTPPIKYSGEADAFDNLPEAKQSEDWPSENEMLKFVNTRKLTAAKQAEYQKQTKDLKDAWEKSPEKARKDFIDSAMKKMSEADAAKLADSLGF